MFEWSLLTGQSSWNMSAVRLVWLLALGSFAAHIPSAHKSTVLNSPESVSVVLEST